MGRLADRARELSPWLKIPDNSCVTVTYLGYKEVEDPRNPGQVKFRYIVDVNGREKWIESASAKVAYSMDTVKEGKEIEICREVKNGKVRYEIKPPGNEEDER